MDFRNLISPTFSENAFYELLLFEIEENFELYFSKTIHLYFDRNEDGKIKINEQINFKDAYEMDKTERKIIEKKEWFHIYENCGHINLMLCRFDRTGKISVIKRNETRTEDWRHGWADEGQKKLLTPDEIRQAFGELAGFFHDQQEIQKSKPKKAV